MIIKIYLEYRGLQLLK